LEKAARSWHGIQYLSICSPNYLHDSDFWFGLRHGATVICKKPLVLNPWNIDALEQLQNEPVKISIRFSSFVFILTC
jgi:UDP-N-acetyl-2-amino-2-deoxyglucuronate dehydrogenase